MTFVITTRVFSVLLLENQTKMILSICTTSICTSPLIHQLIWYECSTDPSVLDWNFRCLQLSPTFHSFTNCGMIIVIQLVILSWYMVVSYFIPHSEMVFRIHSYPYSIKSHNLKPNPYHIPEWNLWTTTADIPKSLDSWMLYPTASNPVWRTEVHTPKRLSSIRSPPEVRGWLVFFWGVVSHS